jgi:hypothetical protein
LLYSHDILTLDEVSDALHAKEKMKQMVSSEGSASNEGSEAFDSEFLAVSWLSRVPSRLSRLPLVLAQKQRPGPTEVGQADLVVD